MRRYISRGSLAIVSAAAALACGGSTSPGPLPGDAVWCDVQAFRCANPAFELSSLSDLSCNGSTPVPILVSAPIVGDRVCVTHDSKTAVAACARLCTALAGNAPHVEYFYPYGARDCVATVNTDSSHAYDAGQFNRSSCSLSTGDHPLLLETSDPTTHAVRLGGTGSVSYAGASQNVEIVSGYLNMAAPDTSCSGDMISCFVHINQIELKLGDFSAAGTAFEGLTLYSRESPRSGPGQFASSANRFVFSLPRGIQFDAVAKVDGVQSGFLAVFEQAEFVTVNQATGEVDFQYSLRGSFAGKPFTVQGTATTVEVVGRAPVISATEAVSVDATTSCSVPVTLQAKVTSPLDAEVFSQYFVDRKLVDDSSSVTVDLPVGYHLAKIVAWDSLGEIASATQRVTVNDATELECPAQ